MTEDRRKLCLNCAWRASCAKRFYMADCATLHCPDYTEDVTLRNLAKDQYPATSEES